MLFSFTCSQPGRRIALVTELPTLDELGRRVQAVKHAALHGRTEVFIRKRWLGARHRGLVRGRRAEIYAKEFYVYEITNVPVLETDTPFFCRCTSPFGLNCDCQSGKGRRLLVVRNYGWPRRVWR